MLGVWTWLLGVTLSGFMSGTYLGANQQATLNKLQLFTIFHIGKFSLPVVNLEFFDGVWTIMQTGNFGFLAGSPVLWIVYLLNIGLVFGFVILFANILWGFIRR